MNTKRSHLAVITVGILASIVISGCSQAPPPTPPPDPIRYEVGANAAINRVTWYMSEDSFLYVDVEVKNTSKAEQSYNVSVKVDDNPFFYAAVEAEKKVKAGALQKFATQSTVTTPYPKKLYIRVTPK